MFSAQNIITEGDLALSQSVLTQDLSWHGQILRAMIKACLRTVPFGNANVVARVTFLSTVGMYSFTMADRGVSYQIFSALHEFTNGRMIWLDMVRMCRRVQKDLCLSKEFCDELLGYFRVNADFLMTFIDCLPGDLSDATAAYDQHLVRNRS